MRRALAQGEVKYTGEPVAAVLAQTEEAASDGAERLAETVIYEVLPAVLDPIEAMRPDAPLVSYVTEEDNESQTHAAVEVKEAARELGTNIVNRYTFTRGDVVRGFNEADLVVEKRYETSRIYQAYLEPQAVIVDVDLMTGGVVVYSATQGQFSTREHVARALGLPHHRVRVVPMAVGGGFGGKVALLQPLTAALALAARRPVRLVLSRREDFLLGAPAPGCVVELRTGVSRDGRLGALQASMIFDAGAAPGAPASIGGLIVGSYYRVPHLKINAVEVLTNKPPVGAYRAPGAPQATFALESQMDIMAQLLGLDPVEFRLMNAAEEGDPMADERPWPRMGLREVLETLSRHPKWRDRERADGLGYGVAIGGWLGAAEPASASIRANTDGTFEVVVGSVDITGSSTSIGLIAAEVLSVFPEQIHVVTADTSQAPYSGTASGSKTILTVGSAVKQAAQDARQQLLSIAGADLEARMDDLEIVHGIVRVRGTPQKSLTVAEIAQKSMSFSSKYPPVFGNASIPAPQISPGFAAHLVKMHVDRETGKVTLLDYLVIQDVGFPINPAAVEGQMVGGVAQGIGWGLLESMIYDEHGVLLTSTFGDYPIPRATNVPRVETVMVEVPSATGPFGAKGVGEPPVIAGGAAVANAIASATGVRLTALPITSIQILEALNAASTRSGHSG
jgi:CO/xanthine dehydrogenase Mo-binding subunit